MLAEKSPGQMNSASSPLHCPLLVASAPVHAFPGLGIAMEGYLLGCFYCTLPAHPIGWSMSRPLLQPFPWALPLSSSHQHAAPMGAISPAVGKLKPLLLQQLLLTATQGNPVLHQAGKQQRSPRPVQGTRSEGGDASSFVSVNGLWMFKYRSWVLGLAFCWVLFSLRL